MGVAIKKHIIIAPHADDELVGCFSLLNAGEVAMVVVDNLQAEKELFPCKDMYGFETRLVDENSIENLAIYASGLGGILFAPDPTHEWHPAHRYWGAQAERVLRHGQTNVAFYSVNMTAPYIRESISPEKKKAKLDVCYPQKKDLWKYDHKYFLFEGYVQWLTSERLCGG